LSKCRRIVTEPEMANRPTIVFLHGSRLTSAEWATHVATLQNEFDCLAVDLPGHGTRAGERFTLAGAAASVVGSIATGDSGPPIIVGVSLGGYVAMDIASRWPERVRGLVLAGATAEPVGVGAVPYYLLAWAYGIPPPAWLNKVEAWRFRGRYDPSIAAPIIAGGFYFRGGAQAIRAIIGERFRPRLARYPGPTLILNGEFDLLFRASERSFAAAAVDARRVVIRGAGHRSSLDEPHAFTESIRAFALRHGSDAGLSG
jgi:pimeloyl-ACP methyl ester carboxylesterase